jgi:membrane protein implicated in regulation of membrane protease activity
MKNLIFTIVFVIASLISLAPVKAQSNDIDNLQKQVSALKNSNSKLEGRLKQFMKASAGIKDSLQTGLNETDTKIKVLSDSLATKEAQLKALKTDVENSKADIHSIAASNTIQYILFVVGLILVLAVYFMIAKKVSKNDEENQERLAKTKEEMGQKASKVSDLLRSEILEIKDDLVRKMSDLEKKVSAIKVKES